MRSSPSRGRLRAVPIFPLEFVEPRKDIAETSERKPGQGKTREARFSRLSLLLFFHAPVSARGFSRCLSAARRTQEENRDCSQSTVGAFNQFFRKSTSKVKKKKDAHILRNTLL